MSEPREIQKLDYARGPAGDEPRCSKLAVASLIVGVASLSPCFISLAGHWGPGWAAMVAAGDAFGVWAFLVLPILSLAMGWVAWMRVEDSQGKLTGDVYAIQAVQISCLWLLLGAAVLAVAWVFGPF